MAPSQRKRSLFSNNDNRFKFNNHELKFNLQFNLRSKIEFYCR
jgi:hypothetical protein